VIAAQWTCPNCAYRLEHGEPVTTPPEPPPLSLQVERLFSIEPYEKGEGGEAA
jgi:hypothetical protein